jgi:ribosome-associated translation inhibitor RaiA
MTTSVPADLVHVQTRGHVVTSDALYARQKVEAALRFSRDPILFVRVRLTELRDPALPRPSVVEVNVDRNGRLVRTQVARPTMREAIDEAHDRLRDRLQRVAADWQRIRGTRPVDEPHEWRHESAPTERAGFFPRAPEDRQVVRHKAYSLSRMTVDEAAFDMAMCGYDFHLFTELGSGVDSVLWRDDAGDVHLTQVDPQPDRVSPGMTPVAHDPQPAPLLTIDAAAQRLDAARWPFVFYRDRGTHRGHVLYRRYDGHYGVIEPAV